MCLALMLVLLWSQSIVALQFTALDLQVTVRASITTVS
jgi:hypothetical protein